MKNYFFQLTTGVFSAIFGATPVAPGTPALTAMKSIGTNFASIGGILVEGQIPQENPEVQAALTQLTIAHLALNGVVGKYWGGASNY